MPNHICFLGATKIFSGWLCFITLHMTSLSCVSQCVFPCQMMCNTAQRVAGVKKGENV